MSFTRVTRTNRCPVCKHGDWCRVFGDGWAECMRVRSDKPAKSGGWMHRVADGGQRAFAQAPPPRQPTVSINATVMHRGWLADTKPEALAALAAELGVSAPALAAVGAAWAPEHAAWAFPMCDGYGDVIGIRLRNERGKFAVRGSRQGIFLPSPLSTLNSQPSTLFVCEGPTDTAAALDLGFFAVGRPNCCCGGLEVRTYARRHQCGRAVIVSDNDKPGLDGACKVGGELRMPYTLFVPPAKDLREFCRLGGTRQMIENTLNHTVWNL